MMPSVSCSLGSPCLGQIDLGDLEQFDHRVGQRLVDPSGIQQAGDQAAAQPVGASQHRRVADQRRIVVVQGLKASDHSADTTLAVIASSKPRPSARCGLGPARGPRRCGATAPSARRRPRESCRSREIRATSSTRSISRVRSRRQLGGIDFDGLRRRCWLPRQPRSSRIRRTSAAGMSMPRTRAVATAAARSASRGGFGCPTSITPCAQLAAGQFQDQLAAAAAGPIDALGIDAPLEAIRRRAVQVQRAGRGADRERERTRPPRSADRSSLPMTSVSAPPITPPSATARSASAITHMPGSSSYVVVVDRLDCSPGRFADDDLRPPPAWRNRTRAAAGRIPSSRSW